MVLRSTKSCAGRHAPSHPELSSWNVEASLGVVHRVRRCRVRLRDIGLGRSSVCFCPQLSHGLMPASDRPVGSTVTPLTATPNVVVVVNEHRTNLGDPPFGRETHAAPVASGQSIRSSRLLSMCSGPYRPSAGATDATRSTPYIPHSGCTLTVLWPLAFWPRAHAVAGDSTAARPKKDKNASLSLILWPRGPWRSVAEKGSLSSLSSQLSSLGITRPFPGHRRQTPPDSVPTAQKEPAAAEAKPAA